MPRVNKDKTRPVTPPQREKPPGGQTPGPILNRIIYFAATETWRPAQINEAVLADLTKRKRSHEMPSLRTVERIVNYYRNPGASQIWTVADSEAGDATLILEVLVDVMLLTYGAKRAFAKGEAQWVLKIRKMMPDAASFRIWLIAGAYFVSETRGQDTSPLDMYLAFKPWKSKRRFDNYSDAVENGWIKEDPSVAWLLTYPIDDDDEDSQKPSRKVGQLPEAEVYFEMQIEQGIPRLYENMEKIRRIKAKNPTLGQKIDKAWHDARAKRSECLRLHKSPPDELWDEYKRLIDSFEEGK